MSVANMKNMMTNNPQVSFAKEEVRHLQSESLFPKVSVIIPSLDGYRGGNVPKLLDDLKNQTLQDFETIIVKGVKPNGKARNVGVRKAKGEYLVCIDDDVRLGHERVLENLIRPLEENPTIGMTGPSQLLPEDSSWFQRWAAKQAFRTQSPIVDKMTESDFVTHMCLAIPPQLYKDVGWENEEIVRGTDPDLRHRVRQAGYKIVIVPNTWAYHPMPDNLRSLLRIYFKNGRWAFWTNKYHPEIIYEAPESEEKLTKCKRVFVYRGLRIFGRLMLSLLTFKPIRFLIIISYMLGFAFGMIKEPVLE